MLHVIDFEVFKYDWLCVIINPITQTKTVIVNDKEQLEKYYQEFKNEIFVGYNIKHYDQYIFKGILCGFDPKEVNDYIIVQDKPGWMFSKLFNQVPLIIYDAMPNVPISLKTLEGFMGMDIRETTVPFDIDRKLTAEEIAETVFYCTHDVEQTIEVFIRTKEDFEATMSLVKTFNMPLSSINKTNAQLAAASIQCVREPRHDEWDLRFVPCLQIKKYKQVYDWFKNPENRDYKNSLKVDVCGVPHIFGWGGLHGAREKFYSKGLILHVDVQSYYPSIMIEWDMLTRNCKNKEDYKKIYETRLALKAAGKSAEQLPYKIVLNATYGICKDKGSSAYDPLQANNVCVNGQLMLLDLLEKLEGHCTVIQSNTDGLIIQIPDTDEAFEKIDDICYEWEQRTRMNLSFDYVDYIYQKDVNNYIFRFSDVPENGKKRNRLERKGGYVKPLHDLDYDLPIVNEALVKFMSEGTPVETTIGACTDLRKFQKIVKVSSKYFCGWHNGKSLTDKTFRVFASKDSNDTFIGKRKSATSKPEKFANTPENCFIVNENVVGVERDDRLDLLWYINLAKKRLKDFGIKEV